MMVFVSVHIVGMFYILHRETQNVQQQAQTAHTGDNNMSF